MQIALYTISTYVGKDGRRERVAINQENSSPTYLTKPPWNDQIYRHG